MMYGKQCRCHGTIINSQNLREKHAIEVNLIEMMRNFDGEKNKGRRRMLEGQFKNLIAIVGDLTKE